MCLSPRLCALAVLAVACGADAGGEDRQSWQSETRTVGDTTIVRTTGVRDDAALHSLVTENAFGTVEGEEEYTFGSVRELAIGPGDAVYVYDGQSTTLRQYDSTGKFVRLVASKGSGPGEFTSANGIAVHRDGRVVLWNAGSARVNVHAPSGEPTGSWVVPGGADFSTSNAVLVDTAGNTYVRTRVGDTPPSNDLARSGRMFGITGLVRYGPDGGVRDSLRPPEILIDIPRLVASKDGGTSMNNVPFSPTFLWTYSPLGYFVSGRTDRYAIDLTAPDGKVLRIERDATAVAVIAEEKADSEVRITAMMRWTDPAWRWNGAPIPDAKPLFKAIAVGGDGRIWLSVSLPGERIPEDEVAPPTPPFAGSTNAPLPPRRWREPAAYDVFEPDGRYLGRVPLPTGASFRAARGDRIWAVTRDSLDIEQVTRFRVAPGFGERKIDGG